jgi:4,5-DOPA dioxygenase extradiol
MLTGRMRRRDLLKTIAALPLAVAACRRERERKEPMSANAMPVIFLAHGAPPLLDDAAWMKELGDWADHMPHPRAVLMISAHWEERPLAIGAVHPVPLVYDFYGFPERYYRVRYASPGAPELAGQVRELLAAAKIASTDEPERGLDHGAFIPLMAMYPAADVPVLQISLPSLEPTQLFAVGRALAPLRKEGVLIVGSGFLTHNMRAGFAPTAGWAKEFDAWAADALARRDVDALIDFQRRAPAARLALPTTEHYVPVVVAAGAVDGADVDVSFPISGFWMGSSFTRRSVQFG